MIEYSYLLLLAISVPWINRSGGLFVLSSRITDLIAVFLLYTLFALFFYHFSPTLFACWSLFFKIAFIFIPSSVFTLYLIYTTMRSVDSHHYSRHGPRYVSSEMSHSWSSYHRFHRHPYLVSLLVAPTVLQVCRVYRLMIHWNWNLNHQ